MITFHQLFVHGLQSHVYLSYHSNNIL